MNKVYNKVYIKLIGIKLTKYYFTSTSTWFTFMNTANKAMLIHIRLLVLVSQLCIGCVDTENYHQKFLVSGCSAQ